MSVSGGVHVGSPSDEFRFSMGMRLIFFHDFENLPRERGAAVESPGFECAGYRWKLIIYPGGCEDSDRGRVGVFLRTMSPDEIVFDYEIICKSSLSTDGDLDAHSEEDKHSPSDHDYGDGNALKRRKLISERVDYLPTGTLTFEVIIFPHPPFWRSTPAKRKDSIANNLQKVFLNDDDADVAFNVKGQIYPAHRVILKCYAPDLAELCETYDMTKPMPINDVDPDIFKNMLKAVYGASITDEEWKASAQSLKSILSAAGKYGFSNLKAEAEVWFLKFLKLDADNVVDNLLYADANNLPVVKKAAMVFILDNSDEVLASDSYMHLDESPHLRREVMQEMSKHISSLKKRKRDE